MYGNSYLPTVVHELACKGTARSEEGTTRSVDGTPDRMAYLLYGVIDPLE